jgi:hypothetical protein
MNFALFTKLIGFYHHSRPNHQYQARKGVAKQQVTGC